MKNILICYWGRKGGGEKYSQEIAKAFVKQEPSHTFLSFSKNSDNFFQIKNLPTKSYHIKTFNSTLSLVLRSLMAPFLLMKILFFMKRNSIEIVYTPMGHFWTALLLPFLKFMNIKHILTVHDATPHPGDKMYLRKLNAYLIRNSDALITLSEHVKKEIEKHYNVHTNIFVSIHGKIPYNKMVPLKKNFKNSTFKVIFFGRILKYKGLQYLLQAQKILEQKYDDIYLEIYGDGDLSLYEENIKNITNIKIENRWIEDSKVHHIFEEPSIIVLPYIEASQSGVISIALECGIPCICTKVGALHEQIINNKTGYIIDKDAKLLDNLVKSIETLYLDRDLCNRFSENAIHFAKANLEWNIIASKIIKFIQTL